MTKLQNQINELQAKIEKNIAIKNDIINNNGEYDVTIVELDNSISEDLKELNATIIEYDYCRWMTLENPLLEALKQFNHNCFNVSMDKKINEFILKQSEKQIDIVAFADKKKPATTDEMFKYKLEHLNRYFAKKVASKFGLKVDDFKMSGKSVKLSNTQALKMLDEVINFIPNLKLKPTSHDVRFIEECYARKGKSRYGIALSKHKGFNSLVFTVMNRLIEDEKYSLEYDKTK